MPNVIGIRSLLKPSSAPDDDRRGRRLRVLVLHNRYKERGGEDAVFEREVELLRSHGCDVMAYEVCNEETDRWSMLACATRPLWNRTQYESVTSLARKFKPDVVHVHNLYAVLSPSVLYAARDSGAAVVQTLHNFRMGCVNGLLYRDGRVCDSCIGRPFAWPGVIHRCYRKSGAASLSVASMNAIHRIMGTWRSTVDLYIVTTRVARSMLERSGLPADRMVVKPHFVPEPAQPVHQLPLHRSGALFVGRLSKEKGVELLIDAWRQLSVPLRIIGDGPLLPELKSANPAVELWGRRLPSEITTAMREAALLVMPSVWYETFGLVLIEAFAAGLPVLASALGAMTELVEHGKTGLLFEAGNGADLTAKVRWAFEHPAVLMQMGKSAYATYLERYAPEKNYHQLIAVYHEAIRRRQGALNTNL